jgi:hypothetical protein
MTLLAPTPHAIRDELTQIVVRDLLGPAGGADEELDQREDHVFQRYLVGMLAPKASELPGQQMDELATEEDEETEDGVTESGVPAGSTYFPSSMGISFVADSEAKEMSSSANGAVTSESKARRSSTKLAIPPACGSESRLSRLPFLFR